MSRLTCHCVARPPSCCCGSGSGALTAAERARLLGCKEDSSVPVKMKCDFNCNPDLSELKVEKPDNSTRRGSYTACLKPSRKDCFKHHERSSFLESPIVSPTILELDNKENGRVQQMLNSSNEIDELEGSRLYEDSGYSSFIQHGEQEDGILVLENFRNSPQSCLLPSQSPDQYPNRNLLPVLHFERVVCSTLKKNAKRNPKVDREMLKEVISSGNFRLQNIIGKKMGLECVDILSELFRRGCKHLLANILTKLSDMDLINLSKVSRIWKKILEGDKGAFQLYNKAMQRVLENNKLSLCTSTRGHTACRIALTSVQKAAWAPPKKDSQTKLPNQRDQKSSAYSRHSEFLEELLSTIFYNCFPLSCDTDRKRLTFRNSKLFIPSNYWVIDAKGSHAAKTLKNNESLKACVRCNFPAKYDHCLERATCKRESCGFEYCTKCLCDYHNTKDCSNGKLLKASCRIGPLPGTKKSKKNLQRL